MSQAKIKTLVDENEVTIYPRTTIGAVYGLEGIGSHLNDTANPHKVTPSQIGAAKVYSFTTTVAASSWDSSELTVTITNSNITTSNIVIVSPIPTSYTTWGECGIRAVTQSKGSIELSCDSKPTTSIGVNIVILEA